MDLRQLWATSWFTHTRITAREPQTQANSEAAMKCTTSAYHSARWRFTFFGNGSHVVTCMWPSVNRDKRSVGPTNKILQDLARDIPTFPNSIMWMHHHPNNGYTKTVASTIACLHLDSSSFPFVNLGFCDSGPLKRQAAPPTRRWPVNAIFVCVQYASHKSFGLPNSHSRLKRTRKVKLSLCDDCR